MTLNSDDDKVIQYVTLHTAAATVADQLDPGAVVVGVAVMVATPGGDELSYVVRTAEPGMPVSRYMWRGDQDAADAIAGLDSSLYVNLTPPETAEEAEHGS